LGPTDARGDDPFPHSSDDRGGDFGLSEAVERDLADLSIFPKARFDLTFHPCSNAFAPDIIDIRSGYDLE
jgi:hypothetical protein